MAIRISGLNSGLDTDAIVQELVSAYSLKTEKYEKAQTKLTWKQDTWKSLNTKIYSLYTNVSNLRYTSAYSLRKTSVSDNTKATVTAAGDAVTGTQKLNILQTAQSSYITGGKLGDDVTASSNLASLGYNGGDSSIQIKKADGTTTEIDIKSTTKISDFVAQLKEAGLNASFDTNNQRIFISAKESGAQADFDLIGADADGTKALSLLGLNTALTEVVDGKTVFTSAAAKYADAYVHMEAAQAAGMGVQEYINSQIESYKQLQEELTGLQSDQTTQKATLAEKKEALAKLEEHYAARVAHNAIYKDMAAATDGITSGQLRDMVSALQADETAKDENGDITVEAVESYLTEKGITLTSGDAAAVASVLNSNKENMEKVADYTSQYDDLISIKVGEFDDLIKTATEEVTAAEEALAATQASIKNVQSQMKDNAYGYLVEESNTEEALNEKVANIVTAAEEAAEILANEASAQGAAVKIKGQDAVIKLNGAEFTSSSNTFTVNGLTINCQATTGAGDEDAISITTSIDTQGIYDKIKDFLTEYNNLINEMTKLYNAESASDYEPLTDDEKEAMSDEQIEKWENKIKDSLLRRDTTLNSVMSEMVNAMAQTFEVNGQKLSLSSFGISTLGYLNAAENEHYAYHIDGDEDDENTSGKTDKLMAAIEEDADRVMEFMKQLCSNLYSAIDKKMKSTELSSAYKVYNDKEMDSQQTEYEELIEKWEEKIKDKEDYYYNQFSDMEVALAKLQSSSSSLSGLLGTSS